MSNEYRTLYAAHDQPGYSDIAALAPELRKGVERALEIEPGIWDRLMNAGETQSDIHFLKEGFDKAQWDSKDERRTAAGQAAQMLLQADGDPAGRRLMREIATGLAETPDEDPAGGTRAANALEDYRGLMLGADAQEVLERLNEPTARDHLLAMAEAHTGEVYRYNGDAAHAVAHAAMEPLRNLAASRPESEEIQQIAQAAEWSWLKALAGSTVSPGIQDRPAQAEREAVKSIEGLTAILERGEGSTAAPGSYRMPEPRSGSLEDTLTCAYELRRIGESGFTTDWLMKTAGRELVSNMEATAWKAIREEQETDETAQEAAQSLRALQYLLRPTDPEYWPIHDGPEEDRKIHARQTADASTEFARQMAGMLADDSNPKAHAAQSMAEALREGIAARMETAIASGQPTDYRRAARDAEETGNRATEAVIAFDEGFTGLPTAPNLPEALRQEGEENSERWLNSANTYTVQAEAACRHPDATAPTEVLDTALTLAEMAKEALQAQERERAGRTLRALDTMLTGSNREL